MENYRTYRTHNQSFNHMLYEIDAPQFGLKFTFGLNKKHELLDIINTLLTHRFRL